MSHDADIEDFRLKILLQIGVEHDCHVDDGPNYNTKMELGRRIVIGPTGQPSNCCGRWFAQMKIQAKELEACRKEIFTLRLLLQTQRVLPPSRRWSWPFSG